METALNDEPASLPSCPPLLKMGTSFMEGKNSWRSRGQSEPAVISNALFNKSFCLLYRLLSRREKVEPIPFKAPEVNPVTKFS